MSYEKLLAEFKEPKRGNEVIPYVLYGARTKDFRTDTERDDLVCIQMIGSHKTEDKISYYAKKPTYQILKYRFPEGEAGKEAPWPQLKKHVEFLMGAADSRVKTLEDERTALQRKVAELEARGKK